MKFFVQKTNNHRWHTDPQDFDSLDDAKKFANDLDVGIEPQPLRIVDEYNNVRGWVGRNGWLPTGGLKPKGK